MAREGTPSATSGEANGVDPTIEVRAEIFTPLGERWEWRETRNVVPRMRARVYSERDLACTLAMHGPRVAVRLESSPAPCFRLTAHCLVTALLVGEWTWERSGETGRWLPAEPPWFVWDDRLRLEAIAREKRAQHDGRTATRVAESPTR
jgi:hypothetical protein